MKYLPLITLLLVLTCSEGDFVSPSNFLKWINDPTHGLVTSKQVNDLKISLQYLPPEWLYYQETGRTPDSNTDSLLAAYQSGWTFLLSVEPEQGNQDVAYRNVYSPEQFRLRMHDLHFNMQPLLQLRTAGSEFTPVLSHMENTPGLQGQRKFFIVFAHPADRPFDHEIQDLEVVFIDQVFETGIHHFFFSREDILNRPTLNPF